MQEIELNDHARSQSVEMIATAENTYLTLINCTIQTIHRPALHCKHCTLRYTTPHTTVITLKYTPHTTLTLIPSINQSINQSINRLLLRIKPGSQGLTLNAHAWDTTYHIVVHRTPHYSTLHTTRLRYSALYWIIYFLIQLFLFSLVLLRHRRCC